MHPQDAGNFPGLPVLKLHRGRRYFTSKTKTVIVYFSSLDQNISNHGKAFLLVFLQYCFCSAFIAGQTVVTGKVTDAQTLEPIAFANVVFKGAIYGTVTEFDGSYTLTGRTKSDSIIIVLIGYKTKTVGMIPDTVQVIDIQLHPSLYTLEEVTVTPGENPAHVLLRKVWKNNEINHIAKLSAYQYENYSRSTVFMRKFNYKPDEERLIKPLSKEFDEFAVKTGEEDIPALPSYITETLSDNYYLKSPPREYTHIKAVNSEGIAFENTDMVAQLVSKQENFYFFDNTIPIINKSFISPLSRFGLMYYKYYIVDSMVLDNKYFCYEVRVIPKREEDPVFHGTMWIHDTTYALKRISVEIGKKAELNFIQRIKIQQEYEPVDSAAWFAVETRFMADAANIFVNNYSLKSKIVVNEPVDPGFYNSELKMSYDAQDYSPDFWKLNRNNSLERIDSLAFQRIDSLKSMPKVKITANLIEASIKGYYNFGRVEAGPYLLVYNHNPVEGNRFRLGGRTNINFSRKWILEGYIAYGTRDGHFKGSMQAEYFLLKKQWFKTGIQFRDDVENVGSMDEFYSQNTFLTFTSTFGGSDKMAWSRVIRTWFELDLFKGMQAKIIGTQKTFDPVSPDFNFSWITEPSTMTLATDYITSEIGCILRYQPKATYVLDGNRRFPVNFNKYPELSMEYFKGFKDFLNGDFDYHKLVAGIHHGFTAGGAGAFVYDIRFTKVFDPLPYPLLITLAGNQSFIRTNRTYNRMNYGEFILDEVLELFLAYHMDGLILGRIPLIKKLQWRSVVTAHAAFGSFDSIANGLFNPEDSFSDFYTLSYDKPYAELSYGIENIFKFLRVDLVHRLTYLDNHDTRKFAVKMSGVFRF
jgi:hypothetical protein